jgi:hypothetical protein
MAFPSTFNFNYYQGDRYEFVIRPKQSNGDTYDLTDYNAAMTIASARGSASAAFGSPILGTINTSLGTVTLVILPSFGEDMTAASYVYDIEIYNDDRTQVFTLVTGTITVTRDITNTLAGT